MAESNSAPEPSSLALYVGAQEDIHLSTVSNNIRPNRSDSPSTLCGSSDMPPNSQDGGTVTKDKLQHDLALLESQATLLDSFLPQSLQYGLSHSRKSTSSSAVTLDNYSPNSSTPEDSVALSYSFVDVTRNGALKLAGDGDGGVIGKLGENIEHVRSDAEKLQKSLEGL